MGALNGKGAKGLKGAKDAKGGKGDWKGGDGKGVPPPPQPHDTPRAAYPAGKRLSPKEVKLSCGTIFGRTKYF